MANTTSKPVKKAKKVDFDSYNLKMINQAYGSDGVKLRDTGVDLDRFIDTYPNFRTWVIPSVQLEDELNKVTYKNKDKFLK